MANLTVREVLETVERECLWAHVYWGQWSEERLNAAADPALLERVNMQFGLGLELES